MRCDYVTFVVGVLPDNKQNREKIQIVKSSSYRVHQSRARQPFEAVEYAQNGIFMIESSVFQHLG